MAQVMYVVRVQQYRAGSSGTRERCVSNKQNRPLRKELGAFCRACGRGFSFAQKGVALWVAEEYSQVSRPFLTPTWEKRMATCHKHDEKDWLVLLYHPG